MSVCVHGLETELCNFCDRDSRLRAQANTIHLGGLLLIQDGRNMKIFDRSSGQTVTVEFGDLRNVAILLMKSWLRNKRLVGEVGLGRKNP